MRACELLTIVDEVIPSVRGFQRRLVAQKLAYLIEKAMGESDHRFMWHRHGPYSRSLARELRRTAPCTPSEERLRIAKELVTKLAEAVGDPVRGLEIAASLKMLVEEVYPRPEDPVEELLRRKPHLRREEVLRVSSLLPTLV